MSTPHEGCGADATPQEPSRENAPGRAALAYRIGTHATFLQRMLARLSHVELPDGPAQGQRPLAALTTRSSEDPTLAFLDSWATVLDVLTFYQERISNEGYLRTATERRSVLELARAIGYELNPGVAASTYLAFSMEEALGAPLSARVPRGTKVQSLPGQEELPQTFETAEELEARVEWNALRPRAAQPQVLRVSGGTLYHEGLDGGLVPATQIVFAGTATRLSAGDLLLVRTPGGSTTVRVRGVTVDAKAGTTLALLAETRSAPPLVPTPPPRGQVELELLPLTPSVVRERIVERRWRENDLSSFLAVQRWNPKEMLQQVSTLPEAKTPTGEPLPTETEIHVFRQRLGFFGHNAPAWTTNHGAHDWDASGGVTIWTGADRTKTYTTTQGADAFLERGVPEVLPGSWAFIQSSSGTSGLFKVQEVVDSSLADFSLGARATGLKLVDAGSGPLPPEVSARPNFRLRKSVAYVQSEPLQAASLPVTELLEEAVIAPGGVRNLQGVLRLELDRMVLGLKAGQPVVITGETVAGSPAARTGVVQSETALLSDVEHAKGYTTLLFRSRLAHRYVRATVSINANVVAATHGETVEREVLGSGDGTRAHQHFTLKKKSLTYVTAPTATGSRSTLEVRVDGVLWQEVPSLHGLAPDSQAYVVRIADDDTATVVFGDGQQGARLPTGRENVVARYRTGIGPAGQMPAGKVTLLLSRPLGIRAVGNPVPALGAADPEPLADARANAPLRVLTLERITSALDYENFARAFAGIGKAQAAMLWGGNSRFVHLTVAAANGDSIPQDSALYQNLLAALASASASAYEVRVDSYQPRFFQLTAGVVVDPRYVRDEVLAEVERTLRERFSYGQRAFAQPVTASEVLTVIQSVRGVIAAHLTRFHRVDQPQRTGPQAFLPASPARWNARRREVQAAELLLLQPGGVSLAEVAP
ncbi:MAG: putative baseplate assembly protein [Myxococcaceae bacterium]|nr:putative baseplate assembly protein [Myxococcaceae bacterium]